jgi:surfeit locus 1 family protein
MRLQFRPLPGFTILAVLMLAVLLGLGFWQLERLRWKLALISEMTRNMHSAPISMRRAMAIGLAQSQYRRVLLSGRYINSREAYIFATDPEGAPVYHVWTPIVLDGGGVMIVDRGIVPLALRDPRTRPAGELQGEQRVAGVLRNPDGNGPFTPAPQLAQRIWYARDLAGIAAAEHLVLLAPAIVEADATPIAGGWPRGGQTVVSLPNDHLQYAITWFLMAAGLLVVYLLYHRSRGRLQVSLR